MSEEAPGKTRGKRASRWHRPLWWLNLIAVAFLLLTYLAPHVSPATAWPLALLAFAFPYQLLVHVCFLVYWLLFRRKRMLLSGAAVLIGWGHVNDTIQFLGSSSVPDNIHGEQVKLLSWNVRLFNLYDWKNNKRARDEIFAVLHRENAGILCLQEFFHSSDKRYFLTRDALVKEFPYRYEHVVWVHKARFDQHFGIATFSKYPIAKHGTVRFKRRSGNVCIWSDIAIGTDTVRVYNAHLASYHFGGEDSRFMDELESDPDADSLQESGGRILDLLHAGAIRRMAEVSAILEHMATSPHPILICGDLNDVPLSYAYARLRDDRLDAFVESGRGLGGTYIGKLPRLRIDHILYDPRITTWDFHVLPEELSDHHALTVRMALR